MNIFMGKLAKILGIIFRGLYQKQQKVLEQSGTMGEGLESQIKTEEKIWFCRMG